MIWTLDLLQKRKLWKHCRSWHELDAGLRDEIASGDWGVFLTLTMTAAAPRQVFRATYLPSVFAENERKEPLESLLKSLIAKSGYSRDASRALRDGTAKFCLYRTASFELSGKDSLHFSPRLLRVFEQESNGELGFFSLETGTWNQQRPDTMHQL
jgi:hypothetical protein